MTPDEIRERRRELEEEQEVHQRELDSIEEALDRLTEECPHDEAVGPPYDRKCIDCGMRFEPGEEP